MPRALSLLVAVALLSTTPPVCARLAAEAPSRVVAPSSTTKENSGEGGGGLGGIGSAIEPVIQRSSEVWQRVQKHKLRSAGASLFAFIFQAHLRIQLDKRAKLSTFAQEMRGRKLDITIVTTAALPWKTGTAVNALLRAAYLAEFGHRVTLCVPWVHAAEQQHVFPKGNTFETPEEQEQHIREWLLERDGAHPPFEIRWYPARYDVVRGSILPLGDTTRWTGAESDGDKKGEGEDGDDGNHRDLCILDEPEHLNWYHGGRNWRRQFKLVLGVVHTNYISYAKLYQPENAPLVGVINKLVCRAYCDRVVKLSDCLQQLPRSTVCNVHGVRSEFIEAGREVASKKGHSSKLFGQGAYFIGKVLWAKGYRLLIDYLAAGEAGDIQVDVYGSGEDLEAIKDAAEEAGTTLEFKGACDHAHPSLRPYKVFVNPSQTEVLSTTTAEALAMGKFVIIERHPSNEFFYQFANAVIYETPAEFCEALRKCLASTPAPLSEDESRALSWAGATQRLLDVVTETSEVARPPRLADEIAHCSHLWVLAAGWHGYLGDAIRKYVYESGPISRQRWLHREKRYRTTTSVVEVVEKSLSVAKPNAASWSDRYGKEGEKKKSWTAAFAKKEKAAAAAS